MSDALKACSTCAQTKPLSEFYVCGGRIRARCKSCCREKSVTKREHRKAYKAEYKRRNPDAFRVWWSRNLEHNRERCRTYHQRNKDRRAAVYSRWAKENKAIVNALIAKRTSAKKRAVPAWANKAAIRAFYAEAARLTAATGVRHEVDHVFPLQGDLVCGLHWEKNLRIATRSENAKKKNRMPTLDILIEVGAHYPSHEAGDQNSRRHVYVAAPSNQYDR